MRALPSYIRRGFAPDPDRYDVFALGKASATTAISGGGTEVSEFGPIVLDGETIALLVEANRQLAVLESIASGIPDVNLFVSMYVRKEALMSSQIEGTQATLEDVLDPMIDVNANQNVADVIGYIKATEFAIAKLKELPLCNRLIKETHTVLMKGVRGQEKNPGEFRTSQNWIGGGGSTLKNARYIPPAPQDMTEALSDLEKYIKEDDSLDILIRAALIHYQFETIHPFLDGNGRVGRLLITLFLMEKNVLTGPAFYPSYFLKKNRAEYYDRLTEVRSNGNYEQWVKFFLQAILESAKDAAETIHKLSALHDKNLTEIKKMGRAATTAVRVFQYLEANPIIDIGKTATALSMSYNTASSAVKRLRDIEVLTQTSAGLRSRIFSYTAYLNLLREGTY
ncbi:MAG: Fic family protein [Clostridiales Family XIII bacterium]|jgi:Fic family protein|nr:Fic family protein [Clostridiales Family XIII bacterium]